MSSSKITSKGQTTIPIEIRRRLRLKAGDRVQFTVAPDGKVVMTAKTIDIRDLYGILAPVRRRASLEEMEEGILEGACEGIERARH